MDSFAGMTLVSNYAMVARRHMHQYGTTSEQLAEIGIATRLHAMRNPEAVAAMTALGFLDIRETDHCRRHQLAADRRSAASARLLHDLGRRRRGGHRRGRRCARLQARRRCGFSARGEATKYPENGGDITVSAARQSGPPAFGEAGVKPGEIDIAMIYDSFSITVLTLLEDLGFCRKGEGGAYVTGGRLRFDRPNDGPH